MSLPEHLARPLDVLMIDNFDSFTWNLYQHLTLLGADVTVIRNDAIDSDSLPLLHIRALIISPGPGHPNTDSGISRDAIRYFTGRVPVLGVCMGLECLVDVYGGEISYAGEIMHGKLCQIRHDDRGCFRGLPQGFKSTRYHSLSANIKTLPSDLAITAYSQESGVIMGVRHRVHTLEAVQYHPESILSESGDDLFRNFLQLRGGLWEENPTARVLDQTLPPFAIETSNGQPAATAGKISSVLEKIYAQRLKDVEAAKATPGTTPADLDTFLSMHLAPPLVSFAARLKAKPPALMAEIKRASPSKGPIALSANAAQQALTYALAGASVISVLTEPTWFKGSLLDLRLARQAVDALPNRPALLRKEFILDEYQIAEARLHGADTVLLIVAMLPLSRLRALYHYSLSLGMEPLVEVNNAREMEAALALGARVIGVNNRNLHDFQVDMGTTSRLADMVKDQEVIYVRRYVQQGVGGVLVGEALMRAKDTRAFIAELLDWTTFQSPKHCRASCSPESTDGSTHNEPWFTLHARRLSKHAGTSVSAVHPLLVGVFQDQPLSFILHCISVVQLDMQAIPVPVIRVYHVDADGNGLKDVARPGLHQYVLLDTAVSPGGLSGGKGKTFDWDLAKRVVLAGGGGGGGGDGDEGKERRARPRGLTADNVAKAVSIVRPWAVDVSGGVEIADGTGKDVEKVKVFINAVRGCKLPQ
ncbi:N-anthranilate isomerase [Russula vinacea]|nr:N-anthranilate isomerase [Russula vinacea]